VPVEVWRGGDDGLTIRLGEAIEAAFQASSLFTLSGGLKPGTLVVTIPSNVDWKEVGSRVRVSFKVTYTDPAERPLGRAAGKCWDDELPVCAAEILKRARKPSRALHSEPFAVSDPRVWSAESQVVAALLASQGLRSLLEPPVSVGGVPEDVRSLVKSPFVYVDDGRDADLRFRKVKIEGRGAVVTIEAERPDFTLTATLKRKKSRWRVEKLSLLQR
jgi:hypothetical protein